MRPSRGFTLIELLVVIAIIGLLASIVFSSLGGASGKARDARRVSDLQEMQKALELYYSDHGSYPNPGCPWSSWSGVVAGWNCPWNSFIPSQYISSVPVDPQNIDRGGCSSTANCHLYEYCVINGGQGYIISVNLENPPPTTKGNNASCSTGGPNYWWVSS